jgi:cytosine/uracil/thiamine/allantoin permease
MTYSDKVLDSLHNEAAAYYRTHPNEVGAANMLLQISNLSDIMSTRELLRTSRVPAATLRLLLLLSLIVIFLMGVNNVKQTPSWLAALGFTSLIAMTIFLIVDLDIAESGTITIDDQQDKMIKATKNLQQ